MAKLVRYEPGRGMELPKELLPIGSPECSYCGAYGLIEFLAVGCQCWGKHCQDLPKVLCLRCYPLHASSLIINSLEKKQISNDVERGLQEMRDADNS